jgi:hypothetical protein
LKKILVLITALSAAALLIVCSSGQPQPGSVVLHFVNALQGSQPIELNKYLLINQLVQEDVKEVYIYNDSLSISQNIRQFSDLFEPGGKLRKFWTSKQIVIGNSEISGDTALVEVSFIDRQTRTQFLNKWGLLKTDEGWRIFAFKMIE